MGPTGPTALVSKASISQCRFLPMRDLVEIEVVGVQRRFGAEMCVASAGMRRRLGLEGRRCEVEVPLVQFALRILAEEEILSHSVICCRNDVSKEEL